MKVGAKIKKILKWASLSLLALFLILFIFLNSKAFQNLVLKKALTQMSNDLGVELSFSDFKYKLPNKLYLKDAFVPDQKGDTLFYLGEVSANLRSFSNSKQSISLGTVSLKNAYVNFGTHKGENIPNHRFFFDYISPQRKDTLQREKKIWVVVFDKIEFENTRFHQFDENLKEELANNEFNPHDIQFNQINGELNKFKIIGDSLIFNTKHLSTVERSGFAVEHFEAISRIYPKGLEFDNMILQTPNSSLGNTLHFNYDDFSDLADFVEKVQIKGDLVNSFLAIKDLLPFGSGLKMFENSVFQIEGDVYGTIERLRSRNVSIKSLDNTLLEGRFDLTGLPDLENTYFNFSIEKLYSVPNELFKILNLEVPKDFNKLGYIDYSGRMNGFYNNFVAFGKIGSKMGSVKTDINLDFRNGVENALYSGKVESKGFDLGKFISNDNIGIVALSVDLFNGSGLTSEHFAFDVKGEVSKIELFDYAYKTVNVEGRFTESLFKGKAIVKDPNLKLDFDGIIDMKEGEEMSDFTVQIHDMNLKALKIDTIESGFKGNLLLSTKGFDIDKITGVLHTSNILIYRGDKNIDVKDFNVISEYENNKRTISLVSDFADIDLIGEFSLTILPDAFQNFASNLLPGIVNPSKKKTPSERIDFTVNLKEIEKITDLLDVGVGLGRGKIKGAFNSQKKIFGLNSNIDKLVFNDLSLSNLTFSARKGETRDMRVRASSSLNYKGVKYKADSVFLNATVIENLISYNIKALDKKEYLNFNANGNLSFATLDRISLFLEGLSFSIKGKEWLLRDSTRILLGEEFMLNPIELYNNDESIKAEYVGMNKSKKVSINLHNFQVENINGFIPESYPDYFGVGNGSINLRPQKDGMLEIISDIKIDNFALNTDTIGTIGVKTKRINTYQNELHCDIQSGIFNGVKLAGTIGNEKDLDDLNLNLTMPNSNVSIFGQFLPGISGLKGGVEGSMKITGKPANPIINGGLYAKNVMFIIDYLGVPFTINSEIKVEKNKITLDKGSRIKDDKGRSGNIRGVLNHNNFKDWSYNINIDDLKDFHVLSTTRKDNDLFYGQAYADGTAHIFGSFEKFNISMKAKSKPGSLIVMPLSDTEAAGPVSYINFKSDSKDTIIKASLDDGFLNSMLIELEITPDMEIQLVLDEQTGEIIKGAGSGRITMELSEDDAFTMRGGVVVERGDYNFIAFNNMVNKKFFIEKGGTIKWDGDPLQATIDLLTYNIQKTSPSPLTGSRSSSNSGVAQSLVMVQARSEIKIKGNLFNPDITFGLQIPDVEEAGMTELSNTLQRIQSDYDEVSRQVFSLLVFGSFMPPTFIVNGMDNLSLNTRSMVNSGIADLISSQIDAWLSQIDDRWLVDFSLTNTSEENRADMIFRLGRKFANNRFIIDVTYGTSQSGYANNSFNMEYLAVKDGRIRLKAFSKNQSIYNDANIAAPPVNTFGFGIYYRKEFNSLKKWVRVDTTQISDTFEGSSLFNYLDDRFQFIIMEKLNPLLKNKLVFYAIREEDDSSLHNIDIK